MAAHLLDINRQLTQVIHKFNESIQEFNREMENLMSVANVAKQPKSVLRTCMQTAPMLDGVLEGRYLGGYSKPVKVGIYCGLCCCFGDACHCMVENISSGWALHSYNRSLLEQVKYYQNEIEAFVKNEKVHLQRIHELLQAGADPNSCDELGNTALIVAAQTSHVEEVRFILEQGADITIKNKAGLTALAIAQLKLPVQNQKVYVNVRDKEEEDRKKIVEMLTNAQNELQQSGILEPEMNRGLKATRIHLDDYKSYMESILLAYREERVEQKDEGEQKYIAEAEENQRSRKISEFLQRIIPQTAKKVALKRLNDLLIPNLHQNRYADAIAAAHHDENIILGTRHTINWHFNQILQAEAAKNLEYFIDLEMGVRKVHEEDRPLLKVKMMKQCFEVQKQADQKHKLSNLELATAAFLPAIRELTTEMVEPIGYEVIEQSCNVFYIVDAYTKEVPVDQAMRHSLNWHYDQVMGPELEKLATAIIKKQAGEMTELETKRLVKEIVQGFNSLRGNLRICPTFNKFAENMIDFQRGMTPVQVKVIHKNCTTDAELEIPKDPVVLLDLPSLGTVEKPTPEADALRRNKIYSKSFILHWFQYEKTPNGEIRYVNAAGEPDPNGYPIVTKRDHLGNNILIEHPISNESLKNPDTKFYNARHLLTMQMVAAAEAINQNAKKVKRDPNYPHFTFDKGEIDEIHVNIWNYLNGLNPDTGEEETEWLTQEELDAAITDLNKFIENPHPEQWAGGSSIEVRKAAEYFRLLRLHHLTPINRQDFVMNASHDGIAAWIDDSVNNAQLDKKEIIEARDRELEAQQQDPSPFEEVKRQDENQRTLLFSASSSSSSVVSSKSVAGNISSSSSLVSANSSSMSIDPVSAGISHSSSVLSSSSSSSSSRNIIKQPMLC